MKTVTEKRREVALLTTLFLGTFMALLDVSIVTIALPSMQRSFGAPLSQLQWIVDGYVLALAASMLTGGALADRHGRKRVFLLGLVVFTLASAACAFAGNAGWLIAARVVQGAAGSVITPGAMALLALAYPEPARRARVFGLWSTVASLAFIAGPLVGGPLTEYFGWQSVFLINLPLGAVAVALGRRALTESADPEHASVDPAGQVLAICWIGALSFGCIEAGHLGWTAPAVLIALTAAVVALGAFVVVELRKPRPMLPIRLFARPEFGMVNLSSFAVGFGTFGSFFLLSLYLQSARGAGPTEAGLQFLPYVLASSISANVTGRVVAKYGPRVPMLTGCAALAATLLALTALNPGTPYFVVAILFAVLGGALMLAGLPINTMAMHVVPKERSGMASATVNATRQTGTALGVALLGSLVAAAPDFTTGLHRGLVVAGAVTAVVTALTAATLRKAR
ncbi:DHA2 family efflux MFS transporter permease subunit [Amycolatopsis sp. CA-230715]|uniref:DHA2 family efflux MFS transporter permease subunit n=1 Tax=Amycolatopsis sp. CA-230715 TaxID=2745196 RepID=UPI001C02646A|nr:DHA2 family efflux MFS transporter permease subunit [Amycolatopsis sp. CA-230715]QWF80894.1 Multidrug resistance protein Stp [Amycolatopsis sp. CA-230715]